MDCVIPSRRVVCSMYLRGSVRCFCWAGAWWSSLYAESCGTFEADVPNFKLKNWHKEGRAMYSILSIHISPCPTRLVSFIPLA